jgi:3-mercaptopyruvate sulfurtransferase SseA
VFFNLFQGVELTPAHPRRLADGFTFELNARGAGVDSDSHIVVCDGCDGRKGYFTGPRVLLMFKVYKCHAHCLNLNPQEAQNSESSHARGEEETVLVFVY